MELKQRAPDGPYFTSGSASWLVNIVNPSIRAELIRPEFYIPYWVGFYGDEHNLSLTVLNAVRRTVEGSKARRLMKAWLSERDPQRELNLAL